MIKHGIRSADIQSFEYTRKPLRGHIWLCCTNRHSSILFARNAWPLWVHQKAVQTCVHNVWRQVEGVMGYYADKIYCISGVLPLCSYGASLGSYINMSFAPSDYWDITKNCAETPYLYQVFLGFLFFTLLMVVIWNLFLQETSPQK
jgi:hypothetical protein